MSGPGEVAAPAPETLEEVKAVVEAIEPPTNFPKITRRFWDVFHEDERNEIWVGVKVRTTVKGKTSERGPIEDVEVNLDALAVVTAFDAAKQEVLMALMADASMLNEKRARQQALKSNGVLSRLTDGLGRVLAGKK